MLPCGITAGCPVSLWHEARALDFATGLCQCVDVPPESGLRLTARLNGPAPFLFVLLHAVVQKPERRSARVSVCRGDAGAGAFPLFVGPAVRAESVLTAGTSPWDGRSCAWGLL